MGMTGSYVAVDKETLQELVSSPSVIMEIDFDDYPNLDIDKAWAAIHFVLCGSEAGGEPPLGYVVPLRDENILGGETNDFIGIFSLAPQQVKEASEAIKGLTEKDFRAKYQFEQLMGNDIYPLIEGEDEGEFFDYIYENFKSIQEFYKSTSDSGSGVIFYIA